MSAIKLPPLPEPVEIDRHIPTNIVIRGYTADQLRADRLAVAQAVREACAREIAACADEVDPEALFSATRRATFMEAIYAIRALQIEESK